MSTMCAKARSSWIAFSARSRLMRCSQFRKNKIAAHKHDRPDARIQRLHRVGEVLEIELPDMRHQEPQQGDDAQAQQHRDAAQQQVGC